jgi:uncharacterized membrane protein YedE/YeeE
MLFFAIVLAFILGFAAHRASVCMVRAIGEIMSSRSAFILVGIGKSMFWVWAFIIPVVVLTPSAGAALPGWSLTGFATLGGFLFGVGGAMNGGCAYSTMARFVDGEGKMLAAIVGFAVGVACFAALTRWEWLPRPAPSPALVGPLLAGNSAWLGGAAACAFVAWALYELWRLRRTRPTGKSTIALVLAPRYRLSTAAVLMGATGALLLLIFGVVSYSSTFELGIEGALGTKGWPNATRVAVLIAVLAGMLASTLQRGTFRLDWRPRRAWLMNFSGGALMGLGTALAPGGNDALVLYGVPLFSPYAIPTFAALALGVAVALFAMRRLFGLEARVKCEKDLFLSDAWSRPLPAKLGGGAS